MPATPGQARLRESAAQPPLSMRPHARRSEGGVAHVSFERLGIWSRPDRAVDCSWAGTKVRRSDGQAKVFAYNPAAPCVVAAAVATDRSTDRVRFAGRARAA